MGQFKKLALNMETPNKVVGRPFPKAWIIGKTIEQITNDKPKPKTK
jgi:hypothetical protein